MMKTLKKKKLFLKYFFAILDKGKGMITTNLFFINSIKCVYIRNIFKKALKIEISHIITTKQQLDKKIVRFFLCLLKNARIQSLLLTFFSQI